MAARAAFSALDEAVVWDDPAELRGEILTEAQLIEHGKRLGALHRSPTTQGSAMHLKWRFRATRKQIQKAYATLAEGVEQKRDPSPAEMWLLDNSHVVEGQLREIDEDLPRGYLIKLPRLSRGPMRGYPLVYAICLDYLRHTDCHLDFGSLSRFVDAYQSERVLTIGELWAVPIMLRLGLVLAVGALASSEAHATDRDSAEKWAQRLLGSSGPESRGRELDSRQEFREQGQLAFAELQRWGANERPSDAFLVTLLKRLREREDAPSEALDWIATQTARVLHTTPEELARRYHLRQAADQVSVGNAITSMRSINSLDWSIFFRATSRVEAVLQRDPGDVYASMDDPSRDRCRHAVEKLARSARKNEVLVAETALALAEESAGQPEDYRAHVGYYLLDDGRGELHRALRYRPRLDVQIRAYLNAHPAPFYLGSIALITAALASLAWAALSEVDSPLWVRALVLPALLFAASEIAVAIVNAAVVSVVPPRILPKFEFKHGIPREYPTLVVVPTLLGSAEGLEQLLEELEVRSLANTDENLYFALLTDFPDADVAEKPGEAELLERVLTGMERLNAGREEARFFLFHRNRLFDHHEQRFMGWERKRGKLAEFNRVLRGAQDTSFHIVTAPPALLARIRYVITLDTDTELPLGVARRLVATLAHPLNRPWLDPKTGRVQRGHALIQPRVGTSPMSARQSIFARLAAGPPGIDPYTTAVSDVYQDLFGEGSFVGKGIYDVDGFEAAMAGRVPDNQLLSHDLFESIYARAALASDIEVLDEQPAAYSVAAGRQHRWTRGDWQLLPWLMPRVPGKPGARRYDFRALDAWRVLDNLRRSLLAPALILLVTCTWLSGPQSAWVGSLLLLAVFVVPVFGRMVFAFARSDSQLEWLGGLGGDLKSNAQQSFLSLVFLLDQAIVSVDAVSRALYRQFVSRRSMLEWTSMRDASNQSENSVLRVPRLLAAAGLAFVLGLGVTFLARDALPFAAPFLVLWAFSPWIAVGVSRVEPWVAAEPWGQTEIVAFRRISRKTWRFFERFVGDLDHHLPPDNFQEDPRGVVAHRTSPTNIGLYLLAVGTARDLGFIGLEQAVRRWTRTLSTIELLEKREGHVLNWYDTKTLTPLEPRYVSTVDSGNLAGYLWTLAETCREAESTRFVSDSVLLAAIDAARLAHEAAESTETAASEARQLGELTSLLERAEAERQAKPEAVLAILRRVTGDVERWAQSELVQAEGDMLYWLGVLRTTLSDALAAAERHLPHLLWAERYSARLSQVRVRSEDQATWHELEVLLFETASPRGLVERGSEVLGLARKAAASALGEVELGELEAALESAVRDAAAEVEQLRSLALRASELVDNMDFTFLYDEERSLFSIGYNVSGARLDNSHYDLLASEARLASLVAIAKGDVPEKHWFRLGRLRAKYASVPGLLSWSGSAFEYLMPLLVTRSYPDTLLDQTCHAVIERQIAYAKSFGVPWGISEAAYNVMDLGMNYQYRAFGVPGLGLKPGLGEDLVVAPYATALAALMRACVAAKNFEALRSAGLEGPYGFYESVDYTPSRLPPGREKVVVKAFMAHHQGMTLVAMGNLLSDFAMQRRFHADPRIKACALLLEERIPARAGLVHPETPRMAPNLAGALEQESSEHLDWTEVRGGEPRGHLLGQGSLSTWITSGGEGFVTWRGLDVSRFREEASLACGGIYLYFHNLDGSHYWSSGYLPTRAEPRHYDVVFSLDKVELGRRDGDIETLTEITASPEHSAEIRRVTLTNHAARAVRLDVTSFTELSLTARVADVSHPAFQKLFIETEYLPERGALVAHRRKRSEHDPDIWVAQMFVGFEGEEGTRYGTSRGAFLGRAGSIEAPKGLTDEDAWTGDYSLSIALDPALILRRGIELPAGGQARFSLVTLLAESRTALIELVEQFAAVHSVPRAFELAWADARVHLRHLDITSSKAHRYQRLLSALLLPQAVLRATTIPPVGTRGRDALWSQGISGDLPIVVLRLDDTEFSELCRDLLLAHEYWRLNGVESDLVILNEEAPSYLQPTQEAVLSLIRSTPAEGHVDQRGGVFVRRTALIAEEDLQLLVSAARVVLSASQGSLSKQLRALAPRAGRKSALASRRVVASVPKRPSLLPVPNLPSRVPTQPVIHPTEKLLFENGLGGFQADSGEYVMTLGPGQRPPQPWSNVMAGPRFGALVTEAGSSFTWFENSQKHRLTPWSNDPTLDPSGELFFLRDLEGGGNWSLTPGPNGGDATYVVRHGQGYSSFEHTRSALVQKLTVAVDPNEPVKVWHIAIQNTSSQARRVRLYAYAEWVLGNHRETLRTSTTTTYRADLRAILARNPFSPFPRSCAFLASTAELSSVTGDRDDFFARFGSRARPAGLGRAGLSGRFGAGLDPCAVLEVELSLEPGAQTSVAFILGASDDERAAVKSIARFNTLDEAEGVLARAKEQWNSWLGRVQVRTPDAAFDLLTNRWLPYQVLACRFWGRSAFYQSGGAYGFRDQLQDSMALLHMLPDLTRQHILLSASRQFVEGDVQHWWHADTGEGVRTHCSDDLLWLPWAALEYTKSTADQGIWDEEIGFLQERLLEPGRDDLYSVPPAAAETASLYEHCVRALVAGATRGPNGLPLMRAGDWNDGMNRMGQAGQGESVWLAWFLAHVLETFAEVAERRGDVERANWCRGEFTRLSHDVDAAAWDGAWYRRGTFDDGTPVGSAENAECRIDAIAQSWAVISRAGRPDRAAQALDSSLEHLWDRDEKMLLLLTPPFSGRGPDPGYIAAYPAGIRENGGQYSHGVLWTALALLLERRGSEAHELLAELNPIAHTTAPADLAKYQVEPYVIAADVYSEEPHRGRGGWTWYTGSASWMYRIGLEWLLGIQRRGDELNIDPCVPTTWTHFEVDYQTEAGGELAIVFDNPEGVMHGVEELLLDGRPLSGTRVPLPQAGEKQTLTVRMSAKASESSRNPIGQSSSRASSSSVPNGGEGISERSEPKSERSRLSGLGRS